MYKYLTVEMPDGSRWGVPVAMIAKNHADHHASEFGGDAKRSLIEGTLPLFESDHNEIIDWGQNNMDWADFDGYQVKLTEAPEPNFQDVWQTGAKEIYG